MSSFTSLKRWLLIGLGTAALLSVVVFLGIRFYIVPNLPAIESLKDVHFQVPLRIYSRDRKLIAEYGEKRRTPLDYDELPPLLVKAVLAAEDDRFFEHPGVDYQGLLRAAYYLLRTGEKGQGGSTITMQVARNFFLSSEKTYLRKINEIMLALKIEKELSKEEILALYFNKIYLGNRAYGVGAAAQVYYGKPVAELNLSQLAMIAGLPKAPSKNNPIANPVRALARRDYVLGRMHELGFIGEMQYQLALHTVDDASYHGLSQEVEAPYVAEMVRADMVDRFGESAYSEGYSVYTTLDSGLQAAANRAHRDALLDYDNRHGYRGPLAKYSLADDSGEAQWMEILQGLEPINGLLPALVIAVADQRAVVFEPQHGVVAIDWDGLSWARPVNPDGVMGPRPEAATDVVARGDVVRIVEREANQWRLAQVPQVEGALVSLDPHDGAINALVGGFDFPSSKFNRVTQAERQPGSSFKPFTYSAALEKGFTTASLINDAPVVFEDDGLEATWRPENYSGKVYGPTRLREALVHSRNLVSIRLVRAIGIDYAIDYAGRFGFDKSRLPRDLSLALGSGAVTPMEIARGYSVFANDGHLINPYFITRIEDAQGEVLLRAAPPTVCERCEADQTAAEENPVLEGPPRREDMLPLNIAPRVITPQNVYLMRSMMSDVIRRGTGRRARALGRSDLAGKTGTTNDQHDAWFSGFTSDMVTVSWVGFDQPLPLGTGETGSRAALPMWLEYMHTALKGMPERALERPPGLVTVKIDPDTGLLAHAGTPGAIFETFRAEDLPEAQAEVATTPGSATTNTGNTEPPDVRVTEELF